MISSIPQNATFMTTQGRTMKKSIEEILDLLHILVDEYYYYLAISEDDNFQIYLH